MYKIKEGAELPKEFKIKVNSEQSEALQKYLFSLGYNWGYPTKEPKHLDKKYLFTDNTYDEITFCKNEDYFSRDDRTRIKFKDYFEKVVKSIRSIAMKCTQENWDDVKPILEKNGLKNYDIDSFSDFPYICTNHDGNLGCIGNIHDEKKNNHNRKVYEQWHKNVFLNACGIFTTSFPEKWCILVTEENYKELNSWMHRRKNNKDYTDRFSVVLGESGYFYSDGCSCFYSELSGHSTFEHIESYTLITTEQFRKQFGNYKEDIIADAINRSLDNDVEKEILSSKAKYFKQKSDTLRKEKFLMSHEIIRYKSEITTLNQRIENYIADANFNTKKIADLETQINSLSDTINLYKNIINRINNSLNSFDLP